jgi:hypothetical protein
VLVTAPGIPFGASERGIFVADGRIKKLVPDMTVVSAPGLLGRELTPGAGTTVGFAGVSAMVTGPGIAKNEVPPITVVEAPTIPFGAIDRGIFVAEGSIRNVVPPIMVD